MEVILLESVQIDRTNEDHRSIIDSETNQDRLRSERASTRSSAIEADRKHLVDTHRARNEALPTDQKRNDRCLQTVHSKSSREEEDEHGRAVHVDVS